jgi:hypothetical protein
MSHIIISRRGLGMLGDRHFSFRRSSSLSSDDFDIELDEGSATTESGRALALLETGQYEHSSLPEELQPILEVCQKCRDSSGR